MEYILYSSAKRHANQLTLGIANMHVEGTTVYFTKIDTGEEVSVTVPTPADGVSVESVQITDVDGKKHLICMLSDGSEVDAGEMTTGDLVTPEELVPDLKPGSVKDRYPMGTSFYEILKDILTEKIPPTVTMTLNPSATLYDEVTGSINSLTINAAITKKTNDVVKVEFYLNGVLTHSVTSNVANGGSFPYIHNAAITDDTTIKIITTDSEGLSSTSTKTINFIGKSYYGIAEPTIGEPTEAIVKTLNSTLKNAKGYTYSGITCDYNKIVYAYPSELGALTSIMDKVNNFNYTSSFQRITITVDGIEYYVYTLIDPTGANNIALTFE